MRFSLPTRLQYLVAQNRVYVVLALILLAVVAGSAAALTPPPTEEITRIVTGPSVSASQSTSAVVVNETAAYPAGTELTDSPVYIRSAISNVTISQRVATEASTEVTVRSELVYTASTQADGVFYTDVGQHVTTTRTVGEDDSTSIEYAVNVSKVTSHTSALRDSFGGAVTVQPAIVTNISYETADGVTREFGYRTPVSLRQSTISIPITEASDRPRETVSTTRIVPSQTVNIGGSQIGSVNLIFVAITILTLAGAVGASQYSPPITNDFLRERRARQKFDGYIQELAEEPEPVDGPVRVAVSLHSLGKIALPDDGIEYWPESKAYIVQNPVCTYVYPSVDGGTVPRKQAAQDGASEDPVDEPTDSSE